MLQTMGRSLEEELDPRRFLSPTPPGDDEPDDETVPPFDKKKTDFLSDKEISFCKARLRERSWSLSKRSLLIDVEYLAQLRLLKQKRLIRTKIPVKYIFRYASLSLPW